MSQDTIASIDTAVKAYSPGLPHNTNATSTPCSCLCGSIHFSYTGPPLGIATELCHCTSCQKWTGSAFTSNITVDTSHFIPPSGNDAATLSKYTSTGLSGKKIYFYFCGKCGSGLWNEPEVTPQWICVKAGCVDDEFVRNLGLGGERKGGGSGAEEVGGMSGGKHVDVEFFVKDRVGYQKACEGAKQEERM